jgi:hypothetical protein
MRHRIQQNTTRLFPLRCNRLHLLRPSPIRTNKFNIPSVILTQYVITLTSAFRKNLSACCLLCCLLLMAPSLQAATQESVPPELIYSGFGLTVTSPADCVLIEPDEPLDSPADDILDGRTRNIILRTTNKISFYRLTDTSLAAIKKIYPFITDKQYEQLAAMKDKDIREKDPAWDNIEALLALLDLLHPQKRNRDEEYFIKDSLAAELKKAELPPCIIESIQELNGTRYVDSDALASGLQTQIERKIFSYKYDIINTAEIIRVFYYLSSNSLLVLKGKGLPADLVDKLAVLEGKLYVNKVRLAGEVQKILQQFMQEPGQSWVQKTVDIARKQWKLYLIKNAVLDQMLFDQPPEVVRAVKRENRKGCTLEKLITMMQDYPALLRNYFRQNQRILCEAGVQKSLHYQPEHPNGEQIRRRGAAEWTADAVEELYGEKYATKQDYLLAVKQLKPEPQPKPEWKFPVLVVPSRQPARPAPSLALGKTPKPITADVLRLFEPKGYQLKQINLQTKHCGCTAVPANTVYGLYPYWAAQGKPSQVDFSALSRIGYFYLQIDKDDQIANQWHWQKQYSDFVNQARQHKTKVDLVVYKKDWSCLSKRDFCPAGKKAEELTERIVSQLSPELDNNLLNRLKPIFSLGNEPMPTMGDGIMLYLTELPGNYSCFLSFVKMLRERLLGLPFGSLSADLAGTRKPSADKRLSLLIADDFFLTEDAAAKDNFKHFLAQAISEPNGYFDDIVVALRKNNADTERQIRQFIEDRLPEQQAALNRKIIPLLTEGCGEQLDVGKLHQALQYAKNNFAGIGLFPLPQIEKQEGEKEEAELPAMCGGADMYRLVKQQFQTDDFGKYDMARRFLKEHAPWLCKWACPNRWWIRIFLDMLFIFFAVYAVLAFFYPVLEDFCRKCGMLFWMLALLTGSLIYLTFACDPYYIDRTADFLIFLLAILMIIIRWAVRQRDYP